MINVNLGFPALEKLVEYVASGIGAIGGPMLARWKAHADADALRITAQAHADSMRLIVDAQADAHQAFTFPQASVRTELDLHNDMRSRISFQEEKRQRNIQAIVLEAADALVDKQVADHEVDHDWVARFFADAQDVSSDQMQQIWAKILAGEVERPGQTSLHTLAILKNMSQRDAKLFTRIATFMIDDITLRDIGTDGLDGFPSYDELLTLQSYGLVTIDSDLIKYIDPQPDGVYCLDDHDSMYRMSQATVREKSRIEIPVHALTPQGCELYGVIRPDKNLEYLSMFARFLHDKKGVILENALIISRSQNRLEYGEWRLIEPHTPSNAS